MGFRETLNRRPDWRSVIRHICHAYRNSRLFPTLAGLRTSSFSGLQTGPASSRPRYPNLVAEAFQSAPAAVR
jgi:hypothetical protein